MNEICRKFGITAQTFYRWRKNCGDIRLDQAKLLMELETKYARMKK
jgi:transposase-like protein